MNKKKQKSKIFSELEIMMKIGEPSLDNLKTFEGEKYQYRVLKRHQIAEIGYIRGKEIGTTFESPSANVAEDKQIFAGLNFLGMFEGWQLVCIDKYISDIDGSKYGLDEFYFKRLSK